MEITGRLTADASIRETKSGKKVVGFSLAINDNYKSNGEIKKVTTYFDCSYWLSANVAQYLNKGTLVELYGRLGATAWVNNKGEPKPSLNFHVNSLKLLGKSNVSATERVKDNAQDTSPASDVDDLPF